ncbi:MAG: acetyl-CoA carboxylase biotin carboxylase subunit [Candidatus Abyssubacteria bacterium]
MKGACIGKVLVANRGEIAIRIIRACQELGIETVAIYSDDDRKSFYYRIADEAVHIAGSGARDTYLNIDKVLDIAKKSRCDAVHPGYGFLAENPDFVSACEAAGVQFIGPSSACMKLVGDKAGLKRIMEAHGIPVLPSVENGLNADELRRLVRGIKFPVIVKPSFGGGGKGMRIARSEDELEDAIRYAKTIGTSAFGNPAFYVEKLLDRPRHIEVQVLVDRAGNILAFGERECSIQRNHQKLIEESPSPALTPELREVAVDLARKAAQIVGYENAGTIEFLYQDGSFYFLEVNARIQVEHSITELVTGIDLIKEQIRIACVESLPFAGKKISPRGWAIQCRVNAEDPYNNFAPYPGKILGYRSPGGLGVRVDTGVFMGYSIPAQYDSLVSKLSVWGRDRDEAISRMKRVLNEYVILGIKTTLPLYRAIFRESDFVSGNYDTGYISKHFDALVNSMKELEQKEKTHDEMLAAVFNGLTQERRLVSSQEKKSKSPADEELAAVIGAAVALATESVTAQPQTNGEKNHWRMAGRVAQMSSRLGSALRYLT